jgi:glycosyltransferase involved in cell wall biosynthesis
MIPELPVPFLNKRFFRTLYYFLTTKDSYDIIQWFQPRVYPFFWCAPATYKVVWIHGAGDMGSENTTTVDVGRSLFNFSLRFWSGNVDAAIAGSAFARNDIIAKYGFPDASKVKVIHNGVDQMFYPRSGEEVAAVKKKYGLPDRFVMNVARLNPGKNAFRVIKAFDKYATESSDESIHFVNIGSRGSEEHDVKSFVSRSAHKHRMHFVGYVEEQDLPAFYAASLGLVFPLCRPELDEDSAVLVDATSVEDIARGMHVLITNDALREKLIRNGLRKAALFSWENTGLALCQLYTALVR